MIHVIYVLEDILFELATMSKTAILVGSGQKKVDI